MTDVNDENLGPCPPQSKQTIDNSTNPAGDLMSASAEYFFYLLFQTNRAQDALSDAALGPLGLNVTRWRCLAIIRRVTNCTMKTLATYSAVERTTLTRAVDQLVARGLVDRYVPRHDRRQVNLVLTAAGDALFIKGLALLQHRNLIWLDGVEREQLQRATLVLQRALRGMIEDPQRANDLLNFHIVAP